METFVNSEKRQEKKIDEDRERPKIYVNSVGRRYVKVDELLRSTRGRQVVEKMAKLKIEHIPPDVEPKSDS